MKYAPSALIGRLSRSAGSTTAGHNRFGAYLRNRVIPTNPQTAAQTVARNALAAASVEWRTKSDSERATWILLGDQMTRTDTLGQTYTLTGLQAFASVWRNVATYGGSAPTGNAPALNTPAGLATSTPSATTL